MTKYYFRIAGIDICICSPYEVAFRDCMLPFAVPEVERPDYIYNITNEEEKLTKCMTLVSKKERMYICGDGDRIFRFFPRVYHDEQIEIVLSRQKDAKQYFLVVPDIYWLERPLFADANILIYMALEEILLEENACILHSSFIRYQGEAILFTGPSGMGKSTQAGLWEKYEKAEIINGDRAVIRKQDGKFSAFGSPYAGSSGIYQNEAAELKGIVVLSQSEQNTIRKLEGRDAFLPLYRETLLNAWNFEFMEPMVDLLLDVVRSIPVYALACRPDEEAVELVKKTFFGNPESKKTTPGWE